MRNSAHVRFNTEGEGQEICKNHRPYGAFKGETPILEARALTLFSSSTNATGRKNRFPRFRTRALRVASSQILGFSELRPYAGRSCEVIYEYRFAEGIIRSPCHAPGLLPVGMRKTNDDHAWLVHRVAGNLTFDHACASL